jgi:hypothetical protein
MYKKIVLSLFFVGSLAASDDFKKDSILPFYHTQRQENTSYSCLEHCLAGSLMVMHALRFSPPDDIITKSYEQSRSAIYTISAIDFSWALKCKKSRVQ